VTDEQPMDLSERPATSDTVRSAGPQALRRDVEALLFAWGSPLTVESMTNALNLPGDLGRGEVQAALDALAREYCGDGRHGMELVRLAGGWAFRTDARCHSAVSRLFETPEDSGRLSPAALECLAVIAYLQPVSRPQIAEIRGVNSDSTVHTLLERELITEVGRSAVGGGALLYGTTRRFEAVFGLAGLDELPALEGFALTEDQKEELRRRLGLLTVPE
jgi:segregation and condensation protein B